MGVAEHRWAYGVAGSEKGDWLKRSAAQTCLSRFSRRQYTHDPHPSALRPGQIRKLSAVGRQRQVGELGPGRDEAVRQRRAGCVLSQQSVSGYGVSGICLPEPVGRLRAGRRRRRAPHLHDAADGCGDHVALLADRPGAADGPDAAPGPRRRPPCAQAHEQVAVSLPTLFRRGPAQRIQRIGPRHLVAGKCSQQVRQVVDPQCAVDDVLELAGGHRRANDVRP